MESWKNVWKQAGFRAGVMNRLDQTIDVHGTIPGLNPVTMEEHIFNRAKNESEYLASAAKLIIYLKKKSPNLNNSQTYGSEYDDYSDVSSPESGYYESESSLEYDLSDAQEMSAEE